MTAHVSYYSLFILLFLLVTFPEYTYITLFICVLIIILSTDPGSIRAKFFWLVAALSTLSPVPDKGQTQCLCQGSLHTPTQALPVGTGGSATSRTITSVASAMSRPPQGHYSNDIGGSTNTGSLHWCHRWFDSPGPLHWSLHCMITLAPHGCVITLAPHCCMITLAPHCCITLAPHCCMITLAPQ